MHTQVIVFCFKHLSNPINNVKESFFSPFPYMFQFTCSLRHNLYNQLLQKSFWPYDLTIASIFCDLVGYADGINNSLTYTTETPIKLGFNLHTSVFINCI